VQRAVSNEIATPRLLCRPGGKESADMDINLLLVTVIVVSVVLIAAMCRF
jgi:hypothetical protein